MLKKVHIIVVGSLVLSGIAYGTILLDNFDDGVDPNLFGITDTGNNMTLSYDTDATTVFGHQGASRRIDYDASGGFAQYISRHSNAPGFDVSGMDYLGVYVRGAAGGEVFRIKVESDGGASPELPITDYLPGGVTTSWQKVVLPFASTDGMDTSKFTLFSIVVQSTDSPNTGTVYIDDIFLSSGNGHIIVDNFNDTSDPNALRENANSGSAGGTSVILVSYYDTSASNIYEGKGSYYTHYDVDLTFQWAFLEFNLDNLDVSHSSHLTFYAKGENGGETPNISLRTNEGVGNRSVLNMSSLTAMTTSFQKYEIPISSFNTIGGPSFADTTTLDQLQFTAENFPITSGNNDTFYLDIIIFDDLIYPDTPINFISDGNIISSTTILEGTVTLSAIAGADSTDSTLEVVYFEYSPDSGVNWYTIGRTYDLVSTTYSTSFVTTSITEEDTYLIRVVAEDSRGNTTVNTVFDISIDQDTPSISAAQIESFNKIIILFTEDIDDVTIDSSDFKIGDTLAIMSLTETSGVVTIIMQDSLPSLSVTMTVTGDVRDYGGRAVDTTVTATATGTLVQTASPYTGTTIYSPDDFYTRVQIPPGALIDTLVISISRDNTIDNAIAFLFTATDTSANTEITEFQRPVDIIIHYDDTDNDGRVDGLSVPIDQAEARLAIFYYNLAEWVMLDSVVNTSLKTVLASVDHFSLFAIRDRGMSKSAGFSFPTDFINPEPNPFSPNGDGIYDRIHFHFENPLNETVHLKIRDLAGRLVDEIEVEGAGEISWDGQDRNGRAAGAGVYIYQIRTSGGFNRIDTLTIVR